MSDRPTWLDPFLRAWGEARGKKGPVVAIKVSPSFWMKILEQAPPTIDRVDTFMAVPVTVDYNQTQDYVLKHKGDR